MLLTRASLGLGQVNRGLPGLGAWLLHHEALARFLTWSTPVVEVALPLLLVLPTPRPLEGALRALVLPPLLGLHLGIQLVIGCGVLPLLNASVRSAATPTRTASPPHTPLSPPPHRKPCRPVCAMRPSAAQPSLGTNANAA